MIETSLFFPVFFAEMSKSSVMRCPIEKAMALQDEILQPVIRAVEDAAPAVEVLQVASKALETLKSR